MRKMLTALFTILILWLTTSGCTGSRQLPAAEGNQTKAKTPLVVFAAGSLIIPFADLEGAFEARYPQIDVRAEYHGSIQVMRHVTEIHDQIDVVATADAKLIPMLMYASTNPENGQPYADWYIQFASNRLALAYTPESKYAQEIDMQNWGEILPRPDVKVGLSDPRFDAAGYRTLMAFALMENELEQYALFDNMFREQFTFPITIFHDEALSIITVPEILETKPDAHIIMRGGSIMLIALLESGDLDYAFEYESVIHQHGLEMQVLPETVNMGETAFESAYQAVLVDLDFRRFSSVQPQFRGERIGYGITIPANAPHPEEAALFIRFLLSPEGRAIMEKHQQPLFDPYPADGFTNMPEILQELCVPADGQ